MEKENNLLCAPYRIPILSQWAIKETARAQKRKGKQKRENQANGFCLDFACYSRVKRLLVNFCYIFEEILKHFYATFEENGKLQKIGITVIVLYSQKLKLEKFEKISHETEKLTKYGKNEKYESPFSTSN